MLKPVPMSKEEAVATIEDIMQRLRDGDSFEGSIEYMLPQEDDGDCDFMVRGTYRVGNSDGQGGMRMIGDVIDAPATQPPLDLLTKLGSIARHVEEAVGENSHGFDVITLKALVEDPQVKEWMAEMDKMSLLPVLR